MTDDLVNRLREVDGMSDDGATRWYINPDGPEAADRIEKLEAALREIIGALNDLKSGQHVYDMRRRRKMNNIQQMTIDMWRDEANKWMRKCYATEERIRKLEEALNELLSLGEWGLNDLARTVAREALEEKEGA